MHHAMSRKSNRMNQVLLMCVITNQWIGIRGDTIETAGCCYQATRVGKGWRKLLDLCENSISIIIDPIIMAKLGINPILVLIAKMWLRSDIGCPDNHQKVIVWS